MRNNKKGFTIVELVIVIAVIGILAAVLIPTFSGITNKAKASARMQETKNAMTEYLSEQDGVIKEGTLFYYFNAGTIAASDDVYKFTYNGGKLSAEAKVSVTAVNTEAKSLTISETSYPYALTTSAKIVVVVPAA